MKHPITSLLSLACAASLASSTAAAANMHPLGTATAAPSGPLSYTEAPAWSDSFADSVGFDASYENNNYSPLVTNRLLWSGVRHLRDSGAPTTSLVATFNYLGQHGIKHSVGLLPGFKTSDLSYRLATFAPYVDYVEGSNEADNVATPNWDQIRSDQANIYNTVRANPAYAKVAVMGPSFANPSLHAALVGPLDKVEDYGQIHNATCDWNPATTLFGSGIQANIAKIRPSTVYKPIITTETGYTDDFKRGCSLPDDIISRYIPREVGERWLAGMPRTYFVFLANRPWDVVFGAMGLLQYDGTPKPQFDTLANLVHLTADPGTAPAPKTISYAISGSTPDLHHVMLAKQDGSYTLLMWREVPGWDHKLRAIIPVAPENITVQIPSSTSYVGMFQSTPTYGLKRTQLPVSGGVTAPFAVDDTITALHIYGRGTSASIRGVH